MNEKTANSGAEAPEPVTKLVIYVRDKKLPGDILDLIRDPIEKGQVREILEALLKVPFEQSEASKTILIDPRKPKPKKIQIRRKDLAWIDKTKGEKSRPAWMHHVIETYKKLPVE